MDILKLLENAKSYELSDETIKNREVERLKFINKFPLTKLKELTLDQYAAGKNKESFCYWLEFKKIGFGIGGGNASKFGIYKSEKNGELVYTIGYGKNKKYLNETDALKYYSEILSKILKAIEFTENDSVNSIIDLEIPIWKMVLQKILSNYFPDKFLTIGAPKVIIDCAKVLEINGENLDLDNSILLNYLCKKKLSSYPIFSNWSYQKIGTFVWESFQDVNEINSSQSNLKSEKPRYWLYAPGENANKWDEFHELGIMGLGWDLLPDLSKFSDSDQIRDELKKLYIGNTNRNNDTLANFEFLSIMKIGDIIIPKQGKENYLGYGVVSSNYYYDEKRINYKHCRNVNWIKTGNWKEVDKSIVLKTLTDVTKYTDYVEKLKKLIGIESIERNEKNEIMEYSLNTIFYGPPGTGKTYNTVLRAAEIIKGEKIDSYSEGLQIFKENLHNQIEFITFHQNYSYEDFIQGLRPDTENESQQLRFEKKDGIFKIIADRALKNLTESSKAPEEISKEKRFELALENFIEDLNENEGIYKITENCQVYEVEADAFRYKGDNWIRHSNGIRMKFSDLKEFYLNDIQNRKDVKLLSNISALAKEHSTYYFGVYQGILKFLKNENSQVDIKTVQKHYIIIIDEINRANISRVFGELITLIEPDKRSHGEIPMEVILPSGDKFLVPSNLYIIGTMNTADKSIALLDIALRRRFEFEPMYPIDDREDIDGKRIFDVDVLKKLNEKIKEIKGYDFQIGHAYFMNENENLVQRMNKKVIPLLLEYFMNDKKEVESILQYAGLYVEENSWPLKINGRK